MATSISSVELLQAARCEDLKYDEIKNLTVLGDFERSIVDRLKQAGSHLLQGARGVGKSMLMRQAEIEMDEAYKDSKVLSVYINFKTSPLLEGVRISDKNAFQVWIGAKVLQGLHDKLMFLNIVKSKGISDPYEKIFKIKSSDSIQSFLIKNIHEIQNAAFGKGASVEDDFISKVSDTSFVRDTIKQIGNQLGLERLIFLFDEVAHTFIPKQQEIFFEIYKLLHGNLIAVKAAVYPTVTSYGKNFEIGHDALIISLDRFETGKHGLDSTRDLFRNILEKRLGDGNNSVKKILLSKGDLLDQCIYTSTGNPRAFFHILLKADEKGYNVYGVQSAVQEYVDSELLPYHEQVAKRLPKFANHATLGYELIRAYIIPQIREKNYKEKKSGYQSAFFTIDRDCSPNLKIALNLLCYSGILSKKGTVKITGKRTGERYMVNLALMINEKAFESNRIGDAIKALSITDYREFSSNDPNILDFTERIKESGESCDSCGSEVSLEAKFCSNCGAPILRRPIISKLLDDSVELLSIGYRIAQRVKPTYPKVGDVLQASKEELMEIDYVGNVKSKIIKNAAEEYISG